MCENNTISFVSDDDDETTEATEKMVMADSQRKFDITLDVVKVNTKENIEE